MTIFVSSEHRVYLLYQCNALCQCYLSPYMTHYYTKPKKRRNVPPYVICYHCYVICYHRDFNIIVLNVLRWSCCTLEQWSIALIFTSAFMRVFLILISFLIIVFIISDFQRYFGFMDNYIVWFANHTLTGFIMASKRSMC